MQRSGYKHKTFDKKSYKSCQFWGDGPFDWFGSAGKWRGVCKEVDPNEKKPWTAFHGNSKCKRTYPGLSAYANYRDHCIEKECKKKGLKWDNTKWICRNKDYKMEEESCTGQCV